jgi:putative addiction module component (TIGR02574 family)
VRYLRRVTVEDVIEQALRLSAEDRAEVVVRLLDSLDGDAVADPGEETAWTEVINRRLDDLRGGRVVPVDGADVTTRVRRAAGEVAAEAARNKR